MAKGIKKNPIRVSEEGLLFVAGLEMPNAKPALKAIKSVESNKDGSIKYEIGYGHNSDSFFKVEADTEISPEKALELLKHDVAECELSLNRFISKNLLQFEQHEYDALISAMYNGVPCTDTAMGVGKAARSYGLFYVKEADIRAKMKTAIDVKKCNRSDPFCSYDISVIMSDARSDARRLKVSLADNFCRELKRWVYITKGKTKIVSKGLQNRREAESRLFSKARYGENPKETPMLDFVSLSGK